MALAADYCTLQELKDHLRVTDTNDDTQLAACITSASRAIDQACNQRFGLTGSAVARVYTWRGDTHDGRQLLLTDPFQTTVGLVVKLDQGMDYSYNTTLTNNTDFDLYPRNAIADGVPFQGILLRPTSTAFYAHDWSAGVQVTANYGWTSVPSSIEIGCLIQAARYFVRRDSPYGIAGSPDLGSEVRLLAKLDPDVQQLVGPFVRWWGAA